MWAVFLLASMSVAICLIAIAYIANKVYIAMENDRENKNKKRKRSSKK